MRNVDFVKTGFTGQMYFTAVQHLETNNCLQSNKLFNFQGKKVKASCIQESVCNVFAPIYIQGTTTELPEWPQRVAGVLSQANSCTPARLDMFQLGVYMSHRPNEPFVLK
jgi:hypothetical protein